MGHEPSISEPGGGSRDATPGPSEALADLVCTNTALRRAARRLGQIYDEAVAPAGLKATQVALLAQTAGLRERDQHQWPPLQSLAEQLAVSISALTHALRPLVRDGLDELQPDAHAART